MNKRNEQGERHGPWEAYYSNGNLGYKGNYINNKLHGPWEKYYRNGELKYKVNYVNDKLHGLLEYYYRNGELDEIEYCIT